MSVVELLLALGLWRLRNWARVCTAILVSIGLLSVMASLLRGSHWLRFAPWLIAEYVLLVGIDLWILIYLLSPAVRQAFSKSGVL
jgi:membrane-associated PAP2 superfamily phosphatase